MAQNIINADCIDAMNAMPPESVDAIVTDPPYGLGFMGRKWDELPPSLEWAEACYRVLKPGGHIAAFGGTRTWHRLAVAIEDAGFEMRDSLAWLYGSGFPKSHDVGKAIDKIAGAEREVVGHRVKVNNTVSSRQHHGVGGDGRTTDGRDAEKAAAYQARGGFDLTAPATPEAQQWDGWGTALKPAFEPIVLARKPLAEKTVAANVLEHGTGAINVDACRIGMSDEDRAVVNNRSGAADGSKGNIYQPAVGYRAPGEKFTAAPSGRWPANVVLDQHAAAWVDEQSGQQKDGVAVNRNRDPEADKQAAIYGTYKNGDRPDITYGGGGGASRFFYTAKAPKRERPNVDGVQHPTVKPLAIMRWLVRLVTPPEGVVLDPFAGSGTTIEAAIQEGFNVIGIEREAEYLPLIQHRIDRQEAALA